MKLKLYTSFTSENPARRSVALKAAVHRDRAGVAIRIDAVQHSVDDVIAHKLRAPDESSCTTRPSLIFFLWTVGMTNVGGLITPEGILRDVCSMIADPLQSASNED